MRLSDVRHETERRDRNLDHLAHALHLSRLELLTILDGRIPMPRGFMVDVKSVIDMWDSSDARARSPHRLSRYALVAPCNDRIAL